VFTRVARRVQSEIGQDPFLSASTMPEVYFAGEVGASKPAPLPPIPLQLSEAAQTWMSVKDTDNPSILEAYVRQFGETVYAAMAKARLDALKKQQIVIATPQPSSQPPAVMTAPELKPALNNARILKLASSVPGSITDVFEPAQQFVKEVQTITSGRLKVQLFAAGEIIPGLQVLDSVMNGSVELGWTLAYYYFGKDPAFSFLGGGVPLGIDAATFVGWMEGTGKAVRAEVFETFGVKALPCSIVGPRGLWLRKEVRSLDDLKGLKLRIGGVTGAALNRMGVIPQQLAAGDIYSALEKGAIDGLEWLTPPMDEKMAWYKVAKHYYYPFGEPSFSAISDLIVNKTVWDELEPAARNVIENTCHRQLHMDLSKLSQGVAPALQRMSAGGAVVGQLPDSIAAKYRREATDILEQGIKSPAGLAA